MALNTIDAKMLAKMFLAGAKNLESKKELINELNVFPVPDGDTGTNMTLTIMSAAKEVVALGEEPDMTALCKAISGGSLRGARGNSGVILSQLLRGLTKSIKEKEVIGITDLTEAYEKAVETAYKAVMKPKEGTILTVAKGISDKAKELAEDGAEDMAAFMGDVLEQGLVEVMAGAYDAFLGKEVDYTIAEAPKADGEAKPAQTEEAEIKFGYCTEFIILLNRPFNIKQEMDFKAFLESIGDSIVCVADEDVVKVHVHTNDPGLAIQRALKYGALSNMKIDNMRLEHQEKLFKEAEKQKAAQEEAKAQEVPAERKSAGFVAVSIGDGMNEIFRGLGVDYIIEGGQTMNPSTEDMLNAIDKVNADTVFILPNNKNVILAANQAVGLVEDKKVIVIPTKTVPQGITAIINYIPDLSAEENEENMTSEIGNVKTGEVTYAVRDTQIDDKVICQGDYMGIGDAGILAVGKDIWEVTMDMVTGMMTDDLELLSIYYGSDVTKEDAEKMRDALAEKFVNCDIELQYGGQPIYYYVISAE